VLNAFEASSEFQTLVNTLYGTATSDGQRTENFVTNFYQGALARPPDATELATNSATLNNAAAQGQSQVISAAETMGRNLFAPQVNDANLSNIQFVTNRCESEPRLLLEYDFYAAILLASFGIIGPVRLFVGSNRFLRAKSLDGKLRIAQAFLLG